MKWDLRKVYLYLVSLITFIMSLVGTITFANAIVEVALPAPPYQICSPQPWRDAEEKPAAPADLERCAEESKREEERQLVYARRGLIQNAFFLAVVIPAYLYHWRQIGKFEA